MGFIKEGIKEIREIARSLIKRDFSGNRGQVIKNSTYNLLSTITAKVGSLLFTIILARMLMPELYGLYGLALSTIVFFSAFSDLGVFQALLTFVSRKLGENKKEKAKGYYEFLLKYKISLLISVSLILIASSYYIANVYYRKPIFYALVVGSLYIFIMGCADFLAIIFIAKKDLKKNFLKEIIFQLVRLTIVPLSIFFFLGKIPSEYLLSIIFVGLVLGHASSLAFFYFCLRKEGFFKVLPKKLSAREKFKVGEFIFPLSITSLSGMFFGSIDMIMLGHFVRAEFVGYYQAAFSLIGSAVALAGFSQIAVFPVLARLKGRRLEQGFKKSIRITSLIALIGAIPAFLLSGIIVRMVYGEAYSPSSIIFRILSLILISDPLSGIYGAYYISQKHTKRYSLLVVFSTILNIILNYVLITSLLTKGMFAAVVGACIATVISRYLYLAGLIIFRKNS